MILEAAYRMIHCRKCGCIIDIIWNHGSTRAGYIQVNYLIETEETYECVIKDNPAETAISDGVCKTGEKYMNDSCVRVFYVIAPVQIWRFIHTVTDLEMDNESYAVDTAAYFIEAAKRAVAAKLKTERELVLYWQVREMKGKNSVSFQACTEIQLDIIVQTNILEDPDVMFMSKDLFEICEECRQRKTFVPGYMFSETACSIPQCQIDGLSNFIWSDLGKTESNMTDSENLMGTTAKTSVGNTSETLSKVTSDPGDFEAENKASPCSDTSMLDMVFVGLFLVAFTVLFPPLIKID